MNIKLFEEFVYEKEEKKRKKANNDYLFFNGNKLDFISNGKVLKSWKAVSGRTHYHWYASPDIWSKRYKISPSEWAKAKDEGPTPPGKYQLGKTQSRSIDSKWKTDPDYVKSVVTRQVVSALPGSNIKDEGNHEFSDRTASSKVAWGSYRWALLPKKGTNTFGRHSFYLHGGSTPGSIGCIDLVTDSENFAKYYKEWMKKTGRTTIDVVVDYSTFNKSIPMEVASQPYKMPAIDFYNPKGLSTWYDKTNKEISDSLKKNKIVMDPKVLSNRTPKKR